MNEDLRRLVEERLESAGLISKSWSGLVLAACDGKDALDALLRDGEITSTTSAPTKSAGHAGAYLGSLTVQGFRGIGPRRTLEFTPGPGLTVVVGRNGSGKSSFAEALEVLLTGDSQRWSDRSKIWKEDWRNLHQAHPVDIEADLLVEGQGPAKVVSTWAEGAPLDAQKTFVQPKGKPKTTLASLGWDAALASFRPFLSYNELRSILDEGPSKLYDALSTVLGLEDLVSAQRALADSRRERQAALDAADKRRQELIADLTKLLETGAKDRASACLEALRSTPWRLDDLAAVLSSGVMGSTDHDNSMLASVALLDSGDPKAIAEAAAALRSAHLGLEAVSGTDSETSRQLASLLEQALHFHVRHGDGDCPVCRRKSALDQAWAQAAQIEVKRLRSIASAADHAHKAAEAAISGARKLLTPPPRLLDQLSAFALEGLDRAREQWRIWHAGSSIDDLLQLASHLENCHPPYTRAIELLKASAAAELKKREGHWQPIRMALLEWLPGAQDALAGAQPIPHIKAAETWLKSASADIRNERFAPIAEKAMAVWEHLRQQSNVALGRITLAGSGGQRKVTLGVTVDGIDGAALGVMSQGELHALALSLFLPRATLSESPFRFVVIDDPVQSMDPARVDGLARVLRDTARERQVIVFTHDERLPEAIRRLGIGATILSVTRRPKSVVETRAALDPVRGHIEDALALVHTTELPLPILRRLVPGFCRSALEAALIGLFRRRRLAAGASQAEVEEDLKSAGKLTPLAALALFGDREKGGDVMNRLNKFGSWAGDVFKQCKDGVHEGVAEDLRGVIDDTQRLAKKIAELA